VLGIKLRSSWEANIPLNELAPCPDYVPHPAFFFFFFLNKSSHKGISSRTVRLSPCPTAARCHRSNQGWAWWSMKPTGLWHERFWRLLWWIFFLSITGSSLSLSLWGHLPPYVPYQPVFHHLSFSDSPYCLFAAVSVWYSFQLCFRYWAALELSGYIPRGLPNRPCWRGRSQRFLLSLLILRGRADLYSALPHNLGTSRPRVRAHRCRKEPPTAAEDARLGPGWFLEGLADVEVVKVAWTQEESSYPWDIPVLCCSQCAGHSRDTEILASSSTLWAGETYWVLYIDRGVGKHRSKRLAEWPKTKESIRRRACGAQPHMPPNTHSHKNTSYFT
jgi:hypothetical protein